MTVSFAAALVAMAARYSSQLTHGEGLVEAAEQLSSRAADLAEADSAAYAAVIEAYRTTGHGDTVQRQEKIRSALQGAAAVALEVAQLGAQTATLAAQLFVEGKRSIRGDAVTAVLLAESATRSAAYLVAVDIEAGGGDEGVVRQAERSVEIARAAQAQIPAVTVPVTS